MASEHDIVLMALESPKYKWRTIKGVAKEAKLPEQVVLKAVYDLRKAGSVVRSSVVSDTGEELFTTRNHFKKAAPLSARFMAALRNRST